MNWMNSLSCKFIFKCCEVMLLHFYNKNIKIIFLIYIILNAILWNIPAYCEEEIQITEINTGGIFASTNGGTINLTDDINDNGEKEVNGIIDTSNLQSGYYTAFMYNNSSENWQGYEGFAFHMENKGDDLLQLNLNIESKNGGMLSIADGKAVLLKSDSMNIIERVILSNGAFEIYPGFDGLVYVPFKSLKSTDTVNTDYPGNEEYNSDILAEIKLWGIPMTCMDNVQINFKLSRFSLINNNQIKNEYLKDDLKISGNDKVMISTTGESIADYSISNAGDISFKILDDIDYVHMSEDGRLIVYDKAEPQIIRICAVNGNFAVTKEVELYKSWTEGMNYEDGVSIQILNAEDMRMILHADNIFLNKIFLIILRITFILSSAALGGLFLYWRKIVKRNTHKF